MSYTSTISIHSLRVEGDKTSTSCAGGKYISIHSLRVEGDLINAMHLNTSKISIHSLRVEGDWYAFVRLFVSGLHFNPLPPCGGRPLFASIRVPHFVFQSTPSVWRETALPKHRERRRPISIHSLRVEGDQMFSFGSQPIKHFNPLPPCGGRHYGTFKMLRNRYFNPLPPCGGRRMTGWSILKRIIHFNPLPPCGGRRTHLSS